MKRVLIFFGIINIFLLSSCLMQKIEYVKDMSPDSLYNIKASEALKIQPNDRLAITVHSKNIELSAPFNTNLGGYSLSTEKQVIKGVNAENNFEEGYLVDNEGYIEFPTLGKIKVGGLSIEGIRLFIKNMIKNNHYLDDAEVKVQLLNFKIMTMGVIENETYTVPDGKITLFEAIVRAGGLTANADASNVRVIREEGNTRKLLIADVGKYDVYNSEAFNLKQNDIVYVAPKYKQVTPGTQSVWQMVGMLFGVISLGLSAAALFLKK